MGVRLLRTLRQTEQVVRLLAVVLGFQIFVAVGAGGDNHIRPLIVHLDEEGPFAGFDSGDGFIQGELPAPAVGIQSPDMGDAFVSAGAIGFVDTVDLDVDGHFGLLC